MSRILSFFLIIVLSAIITHLVLILGEPKLKNEKIWKVIKNEIPLAQLSLLDEKLGNTIPQFQTLDPNFEYGFCRFDLTHGGFVLSLPVNQFYVEAIVYSDKNEYLFTADYNSAYENILSLYILNNRQILALQNTLPKIADYAQFYKSTIDEGYLMMRFFTPNQSAHDQAKLLLQQGECKTIQR